MSNPNQHITEFLNYYCDMPTPPQYAVMLKGKWGSGKTHFINEYKEDLIKLNKKYIYISLYGVTSFSEILSQFIQSLTTSKTLDNLITTGFKFLKHSSSINKVMTDESIQLDILNKIPTFKDSILIFDDLERCDIELNKTLGFINKFVEHKKFKVIIIANEKELDKNNKKYKEIKEKLIGKTFKIRSSVELAYESFTKEIKKNKLLVDYQNKIINIYKQSKYDNLRVFRQVILDFDRLSKTIELDRFKKDLIQDFVKVYFVFAIESRLSKYSIKSLKISKEEYSSLTWKDDEISKKKKEDNEFKKFELKYNLSYQTDYILSFEIWSKILESSVINEKEIHKLFKNSKYYLDENKSNWQKLHFFNRLSDDEFKVVLQLVENEMVQCIYKDYKLVLVVSSILLNLEEKGLYKKDVNDILKIIYKNIDSLYEKKLIPEEILLSEYAPLSQNSYENFAIFDNTKSYEKVKIYIDEKLLKFQEDIYKSDSLNIIKYLEKGDRKIYELLATNSSKYYNKHILSFINTSDLMKVLIINKYDAAYTFGALIEKRYQQEFNISELKDEKGFLYELQKKVAIEQSKRQGKVSGYNLNEYILKPLEKAINDLQTHINNKKESKI